MNYKGDTIGSCSFSDEDVNLVVTESNENADEAERMRTNSQDIGDAGVIATTNAKEYLDSNNAGSASFNSKENEINEILL